MSPIGHPLAIRSRRQAVRPRRKLVKGSLQQRGESSWRVRVFIGRDDRGQRRYVERSVRGSKPEAQRVMARLITEVDEGRHVAGAIPTFGELLDRWLDVKATVVEGTTLDGYRWVADAYLRPALGGVRVD